MPRAEARSTTTPEPALPAASQHTPWTNSETLGLQTGKRISHSFVHNGGKASLNKQNPVDSRLSEPCHSLIPQTHPQRTLQRDINPHPGICAGQRPKISKTATSGRTLRKFFQQLIPKLSTAAPENCPHPRKSGRKPHKTSPNRPQTPPENRSPAALPKGERQRDSADFR